MTVDDVLAIIEEAVRKNAPAILASGYPQMTQENGVRIINEAEQAGTIGANTAKDWRYFFEMRDKRAEWGPEYAKTRRRCAEIGKVQDFFVRRVASLDAAPQMLNQHEDLSHGSHIGKAIYALGEGYTEPFWEQQDRLAYHGGFFEKYTLPQMQQRIRDQHRFLILQAGGRFFNMTTMTMDESRTVADIHVELAEDTPDADLVTKLVPLKDFGVECNSEESRRVTEEIFSNRAIAACITDVGVLRGYGKYCLVPALHDQVFRHIHYMINPTREHAIKYIIAQFFDIKGMEVPAEGKTVSVPYNVHNHVSLSKHSFPNGIASVWLPRIPPGDLPIEFEWEGRKVEGLLKMGWITVAIQMHDVMGKYAQPNFQGKWNMEYEYQRFLMEQQRGWRLGADR